MLNIDKRSRVPIYEQVKNQIIMLIRLGVFKPNSQLPSIRSVALDTGLNVNTIKRAFSDLEADGVIYSLPGRGSFVSSTGIKNKNIFKKAMDEVKASVENAKVKGIPQEECIKLIEQIYSQKEE
ncbi:MAG: GntR family transcriptional regulator [Clostridiales bacterium]|jgi:GntR family transcriptional regulator|nr:GntR family transcriptional regulator [Clostridiales bacterium]